jgi:two-component system, chemotaxis family, response regulator Rcp1
MEILLIEDSLDDARLAFEFLREGQLSHRLTWLSDGDEAADFLFKRGKFARVPHPDLILLDLGLPGKDGRELLTEIKADEALRHIPVVVMTSSKDHEDMLRSEQLAVEGFITKPVDWPKFLGLVRELREFWHADLILPAVG